ncbi:hypothetical protein ACM55K_01705 [Flavobacterium sp. LT1R49]|uniref:hypothetical protein n=1 Tax=Flavobacterium arabinosi TaxID=3398737 RepID=UPI003A89853E
MTLGTTLAVYASICKETGKPFHWPGSAAQWNGLSDVTDARVLAEHLIWASTTEAARNEAFNVVNGDFFRWKWLWKKLAASFGIEAIGYDGTIHPLEEQMKQEAPVWKNIAIHHNLKETVVNKLASP